MYEKFFYLKEKPFHITPDPRFLYLSNKHREAIDLLTYGVAEKKGFIMLTGEVGTGKTTLCRALLDKFPKRTESALILNPVLSEHDLIKTVTDDFGLKVEGSVKDHLDRLNGFLLKNASAGVSSVVIIDESQDLSPSTLEMVRLLSNLETHKEKLLQIILVGQPELQEMLKGEELRQLNQRIIVRYHLDPLDHEETYGYIQNRLVIAGANGNVQFTAEAMSDIHEASGGIPRVINIVCDRALTAAYIEEMRVIGRELIKKALDELKQEGYIKSGGAAGYSKYLPHIALSTFAAGVAAGIRWGAPLIQKIVAGVH